MDGFNLFYSNCEDIEEGCFLYIDNNLNFAPDGAYSDGANCYSVYNGSVTSKTNCEES